ncbi:hypothetical protein AC579_3519 [Pseudocercospora musae]|uniref:Uncharacterized protein n=1 Tax=Pseudocercospora musae TaxID=113226 RepID=A0A139IWD1_9PEZI|nr:hypothetical protein AC579_3519 [Pseudocercospora musae]
MPSPLPPWLELYPAAANSTAAQNSTPNPSQTGNLLPFDTMSSISTPISPEMFALAIKDLPVDTLYAKASELQNSISHLLDSNAQMKDFADEGDDVCKEAIAENDVVVKRMEERLELCKVEVENRGLLWTGHAEKEEITLNGHAETNGEASGRSAPTPAASGRLNDDELRRQLQVRMDEDEDEEDGVHL